ncbi:MAG: DUF4399 domain-containing protein [Salinisphaeraceae bacterium]|nr:DUF4399 domain-containing protein [Salinisphaeraceae bacterium]
MRVLKGFVVVASLLAATTLWAGGQRTPAPEDAKVYFVSPADGAVVKSPVKVVFGLSGMGVAPAGIDQKHTGHHHLLVDVDELPSLNKPIPADENHRHFGGGQTEVELELEPGEHTLQLLLGDKHHIPHRPPVKSEKITITVVPEAGLDVKAGVKLKMGGGK